MIDTYPKTLTYLEPVTVKDTSSPSTKVISNFCCSIYPWFTISICHTLNLSSPPYLERDQSAKDKFLLVNLDANARTLVTLCILGQSNLYSSIISIRVQSICTTCHADDRGCKRDDLLTMEIRKGAVTTWLYVLSGTTWRPAKEYIHLLTMTWKHTMVDFHTPESLHAHAGKVGER